MMTKVELLMDAWNWLGETLSTVDEAHGRLGDVFDQ